MDIDFEGLGRMRVNIEYFRTCFLGVKTLNISRKYFPLWTLNISKTFFLVCVNTLNISENIFLGVELLKHFKKVFSAVDIEYYRKYFPGVCGH